MPGLMALRGCRVPPTIPGQLWLGDTLDFTFPFKFVGLGSRHGLEPADAHKTWLSAYLSTVD